MPIIGNSNFGAGDTGAHDTGKAEREFITAVRFLG